MAELNIGRTAPLFVLPDLDGRLVRLEDFRGKIVLLNFWSCDCPWSARADRALNFKRIEWGPRVVWMSVAANANEDLAQVQAAARERELSIVLLDSAQKTADVYSAQTTPHIFVLDAQGVLRYRGGLDDTTFRRRTPTRLYAVEAVDALLRGEQPAVVETQPYGCTIVRFRPEST